MKSCCSIIALLVLRMQGNSFKTATAFLNALKDSKPACILLQILSGTDTKKVCEEFELTPSHLSRECRKALRTFRLLPDYEQLFNENDKLKSEIQNLTASYNLLGEQYDVLASMHQDLVKEYEKNIKINT